MKIIVILRLALIFSFLDISSSSSVLNTTSREDHVHSNNIERLKSLKSLNESIREVPSTSQKNHYKEKRVNIPEGILTEFDRLSKAHGIHRIAQKGHEVTVIDRSTYAMLRNTAFDGSSESSFILGIIHLYGMYEEEKVKNYHIIRWLEYASKNGHVDAKCALGLIYYHGFYVNSNREIAMRLFLQATIDSRNEVAFWSLGRMLYEGMTFSEIGVDPHSIGRFNFHGNNSNFAQAAILFHRASHIPDALHHLAVIYEYDLIMKTFNPFIDIDYPGQIGQIPNIEKAINFYREAGNLGHAESLYNLGLIYMQGRKGIASDTSRAMDQFRQAAFQDHTPSMRYLGVLILGLRGSNPEEAMWWFKRCADKNDHRKTPGSLTTISELCIMEKENLEHIVRSANHYREKMLDGIFERLTHPPSEGNT